MYRATTPTHRFTLPTDASEYKEIQITYEQNRTRLVKHYQDGILPSGMTIDGADVIVKLTQNETNSFTPKQRVNVQVRVLTQDDDAYASNIMGIAVNKVLNDEVLG